MEIPKGWIKCQLGAVLSLKNGFAFKCSDYKDEGVPVIRISDISNGGVYNKDSVKVDKNIEAENYLIKKGDILIAMSGATTGKFGIYRSSEKAYQNQRVGNLIPYSENSLDKHLIYYLLFTLKRKVERDAYGGAQPNISGNKIEAIEFLLPPLPEQHAIVSKIEQLFSELDKGIESLKAAQQQLKVYRQSVLKWAFEGKLTEKWRQNQALPDAQELLEKIQKEREDKAKAGGKKLKPVPPLTKEELAALPQLSKGWGWVRLGEAGDYNFNGKGLSYLTGPADFGPRYPTVTKWTEKPKAIGKKNGILITVKGAGVGKVNILNVERAAISRQLMSFESDRIKPEFGFYYLLSQFYAFQKLGLGSTVPGIDRESLLKLAFPLCASAEQHQIVQEIESSLSECDNMEATITASLQQAEALRQSILKKAFEGKLLNDEELEAVRQDPTWEPADRLLERIREEKAGLHSGKKGRKSKA